MNVRRLHKYCHREELNHKKSYLIYKLIILVKSVLTYYKVGEGILLIKRMEKENFIWVIKKVSIEEDLLNFIF